MSEIKELEKSLQELRDEAVGLGLEAKIKGLKSKKDVQAVIDQFNESQAADDSVEVEGSLVESTKKEVAPKVKSMREIAQDLKREAIKKRIVTITNNDKRDNHVTSTCYLSCENEYWGISRIVPLDIPVELEQGLIDCAKTSEIILHVDEVVDGKRTGNRVPKKVKRYIVSYEDPEKYKK